MRTSPSNAEIGFSLAIIGLGIWYLFSGEIQLTSPVVQEIRLIDPSPETWNESSYHRIEGEVTHLTGIKGLIVGPYNSTKGFYVVRRSGDQLIREWWHTEEIQKQE
jgi:hypothetical protein